MFEYYETEVRDLEARTFGADREAIAPGSVVFYGSSSVRLWESLPADIAPLAADRPLVNLGFGGSTLASCVHFFNRLPERVHRVAPPVRSLVFYAGENDLGDGKSVDAVWDSFVWLHALVRDYLPGVPFAFISIKPSPARANVMDKIRAVNDRIRAQVADRPGSVFVDVFAEMLDAAGVPRPELWTPDGIHLSRAGYAVWARTLARHKTLLFE